MPRDDWELDETQFGDPEPDDLLDQIYDDPLPRETEEEPDDE